MLSETRGCLVQPVSSPLRKCPKNCFLQRFAVAAVEMREVGVTVHLQPFLPGAGAHIAFKISAWVEGRAAPLACRQQGSFKSLKKSAVRAE